jgi:hypothetical protein
LIVKIFLIKGNFMRRITFVMAGFLFALILTFATRAYSLDVGSLDSTNQTPETVAAMFKPAIATLRERNVSIKILTPTSLFPKKIIPGLVYAIPYNRGADIYEITLSRESDCHSFVCTYLLFQGKKVGLPEVLSLEDDLAQSKDSYARVAPDRRDPNPPAWVTLDNGMKAVFHPWFTFTHDTYARVSWVDNGVRYIVMMKRGDKERLIKIINSMYN